MVSELLMKLFRINRSTDLWVRVQHKQGTAESGKNNTNRYLSTRRNLKLVENWVTC